MTYELWGLSGKIECRGRMEVEARGEKCVWGLKDARFVYLQYYSDNISDVELLPK